MYSKMVFLLLFFHPPQLLKKNLSLFHYFQCIFFGRKRFVIATWLCFFSFCGTLSTLLYKQPATKTFFFCSDGGNLLHSPYPHVLLNKQAKSFNRLLYLFFHSVPCYCHFGLLWYPLELRHKQYRRRGAHPPQRIAGRCGWIHVPCLQLHWAGQPVRLAHCPTR